MHTKIKNRENVNRDEIVHALSAEMKMFWLVYRFVVAACIIGLLSFTSSEVNKMHLTKSQRWDSNILHDIQWAIVRCACSSIQAVGS